MLCIEAGGAARPALSRKFIKVVYSKCICCREWHYDRTTCSRLKKQRNFAVHELIRLLDLEDTTIIADALNCQEETAKEMLNAGADYVISIKKEPAKLT